MSWQWVWENGIWEKKQVVDPLPPPPAGLISDISVTGAIDGNNTTFTLGITPTFFMLALNGMRQQVGQGNDYVVQGNQLQMSVAPQVGSWLSAVGY